VLDMDKKLILLIEDDAVFAQVMTRALERRDFAVVHASDVDAGRLAIACHDHDYAIVDLNLAGHSSLELIPLLKAKRPASPVLMLTGYASIATAVEAIKLGADDYLAKPADANDILAALTATTKTEQTPLSIQQPMSVRRLEWEHIQKLLKENDGNISATARQLNMHRRTLQRKLQKKPVAG